MKKRARRSRKPKTVVNARQAEINTVAAHLRSLMASGLSEEEHEDLVDALNLGPRNIAELMDLIVRDFHTMVGPPTAYFEIPAGGGLVARVVYITIRFGVAEAGENAVRKLCNEAWRVLEEVKLNTTAQPLLFWRIAPVISESFGRTSLRMRVAIPAADLTKYANPEGGEEPMI